MKILVINAGSSSLKYQLFDMTDKNVLAKGLCERIGIKNSRLKHKADGLDEVIIDKDMKDHADAIQMVIDALVDKNHGVISDMNEIKAVGHRVVHGGEFFKTSVLIDDEVKNAIKECISLAPLHNPPNLIGINACEKIMPNVKQVAVFDTAFHQTMPKKAYLYALPMEMYEKHKIRKYGFHGTSHKYVAQRTASLLNRPIEELKIITAHLGNGSSVTAIDGGKSVDTSMGFTPLDGLIMGTRCGTIDPAIIEFIADKENLSLNEVTELMNKKSGVLGISGLSSDFRDLDEAAKNGDERANLALEMFAYSVKQYIGRYIAAMGGCDAVVFTAGIGENNSEMRRKIVQGLEFLGVKIDNAKNQTNGEDVDISSEDANIKTLVIQTNEELMIALETEKLI